MKYLILGIDGGDEGLFNKLDMPFYHSLMSKHSNVLLREDLHSRGWVEIISGKHARENQGFYLRPKLDGSKEFKLNYSFSDLLKYNGNSPLIWELAEKNGYDIGIMNIPTTYPAPKNVNGFFVSGAGGGLVKVDGIPTDMCSDESIKKRLEASKYVIDLRLKPSGITDTAELFNQLIDMMEIRFNTFIEACKENNTEFAFLALRAPTIVNYAGMYEIENQKNPIWKEYIDEFYKKLDDLTNQLFMKLNPKNFIVTADHGSQKQEYHANYNVFLKEKRYLKYSSSIQDNLQFLKGVAKSNLKSVMRYYSYPPSKRKIDWDKTSVFGDFYYNGLYINDKRRFDGIIEENEIEKLVDQVCKDFNDYPLAKQWKMSARPYRKFYMDSKYNDFLPDIWIDAPDHIFFMGRNNSFVTKNPWYKEIKTLNHAPSTMLTGTKGIHPICIMNKELASLVREEDEKDLTLVYHITKRHLENNPI